MPAPTIKVCTEVWCNSSRELHHDLVHAFKHWKTKSFACVVFSFLKVCAELWCTSRDGQLHHNFVHTSKNQQLIKHHLFVFDVWKYARNCGAIPPSDHECAISPPTVSGQAGSSVSGLRSQVLGRTSSVPAFCANDGVDCLRGRPQTTDLNLCSQMCGNKYGIHMCII